MICNLKLKSPLCPKLLDVDLRRCEGNVKNLLCFRSGCFFLALNTCRQYAEEEQGNKEIATRSFHQTFQHLNIISDKFRL